MSLRQEIWNDLKEAERDLDLPTFRWKNVDIPCVPTSLELGTTIAIGGELLNVSLSLLIRWNEFITADSTLITVDSGGLTVDSDSDSIDSDLLTIDSTATLTVDSDLPQPVAGDFVEYLGRTYKVAMARRILPRAALQLVLADPDQ